MSHKIAWLGLVGVVVAIAVVAARWSKDDVQCDSGFERRGARCLLPDGVSPPADRRVRIPAARFVVGPSDWEAEGRVAPRTVETRAFDIDAFEARDERGVPFANVTREEAVAYCTRRGGRLPTEDEWIAAASSGSKNGAASRYPWGDTGAVCRRASWGIFDGPCAKAGENAGPSAGGAHASGDTPLGVHDMAGNVAEWVAPNADDPKEPRRGVAHGGSWASALATELRTWSRLELAPSAKDARVGIRCAYDLSP